MKKTEEGKLPFSNVHHVGVIVRDVEKAAEFYQSLGIGPFEPLIIEAEERRLRGKLINDLKLKVMMAHMGPIRIELLQPVKGKGYIWEEFLEEKGGGIHHVAFLVDDIEKEKAALIKKGLNHIFISKYKNGGGAAYFEPDENDGFVLEIFQRPRDYAAHD